MKIQDQVCTLEQAKKLKELGVSQNSLYSWFGDESHITEDGTKYIFIKPTLPSNSLDEDQRRDTQNTIPLYSAFTVAELGVMLPDAYHEASVFSTEASARAELLIHLLECGLSVEEVNESLNR